MKKSDTSAASSKIPSDPPRSVPEVFIVESLDWDDEEKERFEGRVLANILKMCRKRPKYFYVRTEAELSAVLEIYHRSNYRYFHLSCHGNGTELFTTLDRLPIAKFARLLKGKFGNRRLFLSACQIGSQVSTEIIAAANPGIYSVASPTNEIGFEHAAAIWAAFYVRIFDLEAESMRDCDVEEILTELCRLFGVSMQWSWHTRQDDTWHHKVLS
jgi:hypothetical protein